MRESEWAIFIDNKMINKSTPKELGKSLSTVPPIAIIEIIQSHAIHSFKIQYESNVFIWKPDNSNSNEEKDWDENFSKLNSAIAYQFNLNNKYDIQYTNNQHDVVTSRPRRGYANNIHQHKITTGSDLYSVHRKLNNTNSIGQITVVKINDEQIAPIKQLRMNFKSSFFHWSPPETNCHDDEWKKHYDGLMQHGNHKITTQFDVKKSNVKLQDVDECEIVDSDDLNATWKSLVNDRSKHVIDIQISFNQHYIDSDAYNVNNEAEEIMNGLELSELQMLQSVVNKDKLKNESENQPIDKTNNFRMDWWKVCNAISHEMWPILSSTVKAIIDNTDAEKHKIINVYKLTDDVIDDVIDILKTQRHLAVEERQYLKQLVQRAATFSPKTRLSAHMKFKYFKKWGKKNIYI
eukprot:81057_1